MQKVRNWLNYEPETDSTHEPENKLPSMTVPDLSLTPQQLEERMRMGLPPEGERIPIYDEGDPYPDISRLDLVERQQFIQHYDAEIKKLLTPKEATEAAFDQSQKEKAEQQKADDAYNEVIEQD